ncbi:MAG: response regulator [Terriglobales bacterium]
MSKGAISAAKVLIVDDEPSVRSMLKAVLESNHYKVTLAVSASDARQKLASDDFDAVLSDMRMETPRAGFDVVHAARLKSPQPAIILITAFPIRPDEMIAERIDALLTKPVPIAQLFSTIERLLAQRVG